MLLKYALTKRICELSWSEIERKHILRRFPRSVFSLGTSCRTSFSSRTPGDVHSFDATNIVVRSWFLVACLKRSVPSPAKLQINVAITCLSIWWTFVVYLVAPYVERRPVYIHYSLHCLFGARTYYVPLSCKARPNRSPPELCLP